MSTETLQKLIEHAASWPVEDQQELADYARVIHARRVGHYEVTEAERAALAEGIAQADRGDFVSAEEISAADKRHGS